MKKLTIFGREYVIIERKNHDNSIRMKTIESSSPTPKNPATPS